MQNELLSIDAKFGKDRFKSPEMRVLNDTENLLDKSSAEYCWRHLFNDLSTSATANY